MQIAGEALALLRHGHVGELGPCLAELHVPHAEVAHHHHQQPDASRARDEANDGAAVCAAERGADAREHGAGHDRPEASRRHERDAGRAVCE